jgi:hypothetical protein
MALIFRWWCGRPLRTRDGKLLQLVPWHERRETSAEGIIMEAGVPCEPWHHGKAEGVWLTLRNFSSLSLNPKIHISSPSQILLSNFFYHLCRFEVRSVHPEDRPPNSKFSHESFNHRFCLISSIAPPAIYMCKMCFPLHHLFYLPVSIRVRALEYNKFDFSNERHTSYLL